MKLCLKIRLKYNLSLYHYEMITFPVCAMRRQKDLIQSRRKLKNMN